MIFHALTVIGMLLLSPVRAAEEETLYMKIKAQVEQESQTKEAELVIQRFALGIYYDNEQQTVKIDASGKRSMVPFEMRKEEYVDYALKRQDWYICDFEDDGQTISDYLTCMLVQKMLNKLVANNAWHRTIGRDLQMIASGYESGIDGYPGKPVDAVSRLSSIAHLWRATNDPFVSPILEVLTRARPWPVGKEEDIEKKAKEIVDMVMKMKKEWKKKEDRSEMTAAIWRYRNGARYLVEHEGECEAAEEQRNAYQKCMEEVGDKAYCEGLYGGTKPDPDQVWLTKRWCELEKKMTELSDILKTDTVEIGNERDIVYPSFVDKKKNIYLWMRYDDVGLQWYVPLEPMQTSLTPPEYDDCMEEGNIRDCYDKHKESLVRGGNYPSKQGQEERKQQPHLGVGGIATGGGSSSSSSSSSESFEEVMKKNSVVPEPKETEGICSHPFGRRGYLCRRIEYEACDLTEAQQDQLEEAGTGGIVLTRCQPERFKDDVARKTSGANICGIGGWRETVQANLVEDTPQQQPDLQPSACSACVVDVICSNECVPGVADMALTRYDKIGNGRIEICVPSNPPGKGVVVYLLIHELIHAQQSCSESNLDTYERVGLLDKTKKHPAECCAAEREAYFVQCKMMALDGVLDKAGVTIDQCASAYANFSCKAHDDDPDDENYVCTNDGINPQLVSKAINNTIKEMADQIKLPTTCADALKDPRVKAIYNSFPLACKPGCEAAYQNTIGNNLCYTGQCLEETHEWARDNPGRMGLTTVDEDFPWDACELPDPNLGRFEVLPAITGPKFPLYRPALLVQELDNELCQINGLPARTPPILCGYDPGKRLGLPPLTGLQSVGDFGTEPEQYDVTGLGIQYAASAIGSRIATDMFVEYLRTGARGFTDLLNTANHVLTRVGDLKFPPMMCPRYTDESFSCSRFESQR